MKHTQYVVGFHPIDKVCARIEVGHQQIEGLSDIN